MNTKWGQYLGLDECPYARRWVIEGKLGSVRVHHFYKSDDERAFHDHPWWFLTFVFKGGYTDVNPDEEDHVRAPAIRFRRAEHRHTVRTDPGGAWTLVVSGPKKRVWGFWVPDILFNDRRRARHGDEAAQERIDNAPKKFLRNERYFRQWGHHPCE